MNLAAIREWFWAGSPGRRLLVHLLISAVVVAIPIGLLDSQGSFRLLLVFVSWDFGAWYMDKIYTARLERG